MGYQRGDNRYGGNDYRDDRWREQNRSRSGGDFDRGRGSREDDGRGFFERAGEQVRSWFSDDDDDYQRPRDQDENYYRRQSGYGGDAQRDRYGMTADRDRGSRENSGFGSSRAGYGPPPRSAYGAGGIRGGDLHDPHYSDWRSREIEQLDRDYDEYRRENQSKFEQEFGGWREKRKGQRQSLSRVSENMEVVGSDGKHIGTVDKIRGDRIILAKNDENAGGHHHSIPCSWIDRVEDKVTINKSADDAIKAWRDEDTSRALFEREDQGSDGPHVLDRSFSGTY